MISGMRCAALRRGAGTAFFAALVGFVACGSAAASGPSIDGIRGVVHVHAADMGAPGYIAGSMYGLYASTSYSALQSPRGQAEDVTFGGSAITLSYTPTSSIELAVRGTAENQSVTPVQGDGDSQMAFGNVALGVKALLTPAQRTTWSLAAEAVAATSTGDENALVGTWNPEGFDVGGRLDLTFSPMRADRARSMRAHANAGFLARTGEFDEAAWAATSAGPTPQRLVSHGDLFTYGAAIEVPAPKSFTFFTEWSGEYDVDADAPLDDNPMRVTPGLRWSARGGSVAVTAAWDVSVASNEAGPRNQIVGGVTFGGYSAAVTGRVVGVVRDAETGQPIPGARVSSRNPGAQASIADADGRFSAKLEEGYVVLDFAADGYTPKTRVVEVQGHDDVTLEFSLAKRDPFGTIQGRVQDGVKGTPIVARVRVLGDGTWTECDPETGTYVLDRVPEGPVTIEFEARDYLPWSAQAQVVAGQVVARHASLDPDPNATLARVDGVVKDAVSGRAIDATISIGGPGGRIVPVDPTTGAFTVQLESGTYSVTIAKQGYLSKTERIVVEERQSMNRDIALTPLPSSLALGGAVFDAGSTTIKRESMGTLDDAGRFLLENPQVRIVIRGHSDPDGEPQDLAELAQLRADAVMKYLVVTFGIDPVRLRSIGSEERVKNPGTVEMEVEAAAGRE